MEDQENIRQAIDAVRTELSGYRQAFIDYMTRSSETNERVYREIHRMRLENQRTNGELQRVSSEAAAAVRLAQEVSKQANWNSARLDKIQLDDTQERALRKGKQLVWRFVCNSIYLAVSGAFAIIAYVVGLSDPAREKVSNWFTWSIEYFFG